MQLMPRPSFVRRRELVDDRLDPQSRATAAYAFGRSAVALTAMLVLAARMVSEARAELAGPVIAHGAFAATALLAALLVFAADDEARRTWARTLVAVDLVAFGAYSLAFASVPGAGSLAPVFILLAGPLLWGWRGLCATALPVGTVASVWPQQDALGQTSDVWEVWLLVLLFTAPAAAVSNLVRRSSARLARAEEHFRTAFDDASSGMALLDERGCVLRANPALHTLLGVPDLTGIDLRSHAADGQALERGLAALSVEQRASRFELELRDAHEQVRWVSVVASAICGDGRVQRVIVQAEDVTEHRRLQDRLSFEATHDTLTGLPNHRVLHERLTRALEAHQPVAVLFVDLDRFKLVNDSLGHGVGDRLLVAAAERLQECLRPGDLVARLGGDEFVVLCTADEDRGGIDALGLAQRVVLSLRPPFHTSDGFLSATGSVGVAVAADGATVETLVRDADTAMYAAKNAGGNRAVVFTDQLRRDVVRRREIESGLRDALRAEVLQLAYQPVVDGAGRVVAVEALLRWPENEHAADAAELVAVAEQSDLVAELGLFVVRRALLDSATWPAHVRLHVNVSAQQLDDAFPAALARTLAELRPLPDRLCLELTETAVRDDLANLVAKLQQLRALGVRLAIDDFGVGTASLTYLARLPVQDLKIDRSFVRGLPEDDGSAAIVAGVVAMARAYGMQVIAEGVETREQDLACVRLGCTMRQGFLHHRPMGPADLHDLLWSSVARGGAIPQPRVAAGGLVAVPPADV